MWKLSHNMHKIHWNHWKWSFYGLLTVQSAKKKKAVSAFLNPSPFSMLCYRIRSQSSDPVQGWCHDLAALLVDRVWNKRFVQPGTSWTYWNFEEEWVNSLGKVDELSWLIWRGGLKGRGPRTRLRVRDLIKRYDQLLWVFCLAQRMQHQCLQIRAVLEGRRLKGDHCEKLGYRTLAPPDISPPLGH